MTDTVRADLIEDGCVLRVTVDHPKGNVLTRAVMTALDEILVEHAGEPHLRLVLIGAAGKHFSFGASVEEHRAETAPAMLEAFHALIRRIGNYPVPVASLVQGRCLGGAFELVLASSFVFAAPSAVFACPEIELGVFPPVLAALGPSRLGAPLAERLLLTGADLDAESARAVELVTEIVPDDRPLEDAALAWYRDNLAPLSAHAIRQGLTAVRMGTDSRRLLGEVLDAAERQYLGGVVPSRDGNEGIEAFLARRRPEWRDE